MMKFIVTSVFAVFLAKAFAATTQEHSVLSVKFVKNLNKKQNYWLAGRNFPDNVTIEMLQKRNGFLGLHSDPLFQPLKKVHRVAQTTIPSSFDAREKWSYCDSIKSVRDQGACGSCWAFATAEVMTDRTCIHSSGSATVIFSVEDILDCCGDCGNCDGGYPMNSFYYYYQRGAVSGGEMNSNQGCKPYSSEAHDNGKTLECVTSCRKGYSLSYENDKRYGVQPYIVDSAVEQIQIEIMTNGPLAVMFRVYGDFYSYQSGVYRHVDGDYAGNHSVKIIGWGSENGQPYWLIANSWGSEFGKDKGFFKMLRGQNECGIEEYPYTVMPNL